MSTRRTRAAVGSGQVEDEIEIEGAGGDAPVLGGGVGGDTGHDGRDMISASQAFPYDYLQGSGEAGRESPNQKNHIAIVKMIKEKRAQRNSRYKVATVTTDRITERVPEDGTLDPEDVEDATEVLNDALKDIKAYTQ